MSVAISKKIELGVATEYHHNGTAKCVINGSHIATYDAHGIIQSILYNNIYCEFAPVSGYKRIVNIITGANCTIDDLIDNERRKAACRQIGIDEMMCTYSIDGYIIYYHNGITETCKSGIISLQSDEMPNVIIYT